MAEDKLEISQIIKNSEKAELIEFMQDNIGEADKAVIIFAKPNGKGGLSMILRQMGFDYLYEIQGFIGWVMDVESGIVWDGDNEVVD